MIKALLLLAALGVIFGAVTSRAQAAPGGLTIQVPASVRAGEALELRAILVDGGGQPISDAGVEFRLGNTMLGRTLTDATGVANRAVASAPAAGEYTVTASYGGRPSLGYAAATASARLTVARALATLQTVPALAGVQVRVGDEVFTSEADGKIQVEADAAGTYVAQVLPWSSPDGAEQASFVRWNDDPAAASMPIRIPNSRASYLGFEVSYLFSVQFKDLDGQPVDWSHVQSAVLRGSTTVEVHYDSDKPQWLLANRLLRQGSELVPTPVQYAVKSVTIDGAEVVNSQQQRFLPTPGGTYTAEVLMFDAHVRVTDAFFGRAAGDSILLEYPDGRQVEQPVPSDGELTIPRLPRGDYKIRPLGDGLSFSRPLAMSREQDVELQVITYPDMLVVGSVAAVLLLGVLVIGRRAWVGRRVSALTARPAAGGRGIGPAPADNPTGRSGAALSPDEAPVLPDEHAFPCRPTPPPLELDGRSPRRRRRVRNS